MSERPLTAHDDRPHEHGGEHGWTESISFSFADPAIIGVLRARWEPGEQQAHADLLLRLEDGTLVRAAERRSGVSPRETTIGGLSIEALEPMQRWTLTFEVTALSGTARDGAIVAAGRSVAVSGSLEVRALGAADGFATRRQTITEQRFASIVSSGSFAQPIAATGELRVGQRRLRLDALGVRSRTWGVREADPNDARLHVAFDPTHAVWFERGILGDAEVAVAGSAGSIKVPDQLDVHRGADGAPTKLVLGGLSAEVLAVLPADPGEAADRLVLRCRNGNLDALGVAELAIRDAAPAEPEPAAEPTEPEASAQPEGDEDAVADRQDARDEVDVLGDEPVVLDDR